MQSPNNRATPNVANTAAPSSAPSADAQTAPSSGGAAAAAPSSAPPPPSSNNPLSQQQQQVARQVATRICGEFPEHFGWDEADAKRKGCRYFLVRVIGQGASATVLQIRRTEDNAPFALKFVDLTTMAEADKQRARAEIDCLCSCDIFTVVRCHEEFVKFPQLPSGQTNSPATLTTHTTNNANTNLRREDLTNADLDNPRIFALVLDYANAGDLRMEIKNRAKANRPFKEHEAGLLFLQVLIAVHHVHSKHMIHRDIKSANVLLCTNGLLKLGDFGFSRIYHNATVSDNVGRTFCGTPYYVAPEIWRRRPYSKKADIFSIGVLLYELLTLKRPFDGNTVQDVMERTLSTKYDPLPDTISKEMRELVSLLLCDDPDRRPNTRQLLRLPICKLFLDALLGIILTQSTFDEPLRAQIRQDVSAVRESLEAKEKLRQRLLMNPSASINPSASTVTNNNATNPTATEITGIFLRQQDIVCEGMLLKLSVDGRWKKRYLCILHRHRSDGSRSENAILSPPAAGADGPATPATSVQGAAYSLSLEPPCDPPENYELILSVNKENASQQCIITNFLELEDVFPVPFKYAGPGLENVFAIAFKSGVKRLTFQASSREENTAWRVAIQQVLGLDNY